jgi:hypothetical protein
MMLLYFILGFEFKLELPGIRIKKFQNHSYAFIHNITIDQPNKL